MGSFPQMLGPAMVVADHSADPTNLRTFPSAEDGNVRKFGWIYSSCPSSSRRRGSQPPLGFSPTLPR